MIFGVITLTYLSVFKFSVDAPLLPLFSHSFDFPSTDLRPCTFTLGKNGRLLSVSFENFIYFLDLHVGTASQRKQKSLKNSDVFSHCVSFNESIYYCGHRNGTISTLDLRVSQNTLLQNSFSNKRQIIPSSVLRLNTSNEFSCHYLIAGSVDDLISVYDLRNPTCVLKEFIDSSQYDFYHTTQSSNINYKVSEDYSKIYRKTNTDLLELSLFDLSNTGHRKIYTNENLIDFYLKDGDMPVAVISK